MRLPVHFFFRCACRRNTSLRCGKRDPSLLVILLRLGARAVRVPVAPVVLLLLVLLLVVLPVARDRHEVGRRASHVVVGEGTR